MSFIDKIKELLKGIFGSPQEEAPRPAGPRPKSPTHVNATPVSPFKLEVVAPCNGVLVAQKDIPDEGFSEGHMGSGFGIKPTDGRFKVFMNGELVVLYKTKHAYFIRDPESTISVMLHIGINTVEIDESKQAFTTGRSVGENLSSGADLCQANLEVIEAEGKSTVTALLIQQEGMENKKIVYNKKAGDTVSAGDLLMTIVAA